MYTSMLGSEFNPARNDCVNQIVFSRSRDGFLEFVLMTWWDNGALEFYYGHYDLSLLFMMPPTGPEITKITLEKALDLVDEMRDLA